MSDECRHCTIKGDIRKCKETYCSKHTYWYSQEIAAENRNLEHENAILIDALGGIIKCDAYDSAGATHVIATDALKQVEG